MGIAERGEATETVDQEEARAERETIERKRGKPRSEKQEKQRKMLTNKKK